MRPQNNKMKVVHRSSSLTQPSDLLRQIHGELNEISVLISQFGNSEPLLTNVNTYGCSKTQTTTRTEKT